MHGKVLDNVDGEVDRKIHRKVNGRLDAKLDVKVDGRVDAKLMAELMTKLIAKDTANCTAKFFATLIAKSKAKLIVKFMTKLLDINIFTCIVSIHHKFYFWTWVGLFPDKSVSTQYNTTIHIVKMTLLFYIPSLESIDSICEKQSHGSLRWNDMVHEIHDLEMEK